MLTVAIAAVPTVPAAFGVVGFLEAKHGRDGEVDLSAFMSRGPVR